MKLMEKMRQKKLGNKGFSLVELIIVIAIMAILLGIVGTQVIPYLNKAREAKDLQIINSYSTSAVTIYSSHAEDFATFEGAANVLWCSVYGASNTTATNLTNSGIIASSAKELKGDVAGDDEAKALYKIAGYFTGTNCEMKELVGYKDADELTTAMSSSKKTNVKDVVVVIDFKQGVITAQAVDDAGKVVFETVTSQIGTAN